MFEKSSLGKANQLVVVMLLIMSLTACWKKVPLEMVPFGTLDRNDYRILHEICSKHVAFLPVFPKVESQMPYVAHYIKMPSFYFTIDEFKDKSAIFSICKAIRDDQYGINLSAPTDTVEWLNELIRIPDLYDRILEKKKVPFSADIRHLVQMTNDYRHTKKIVYPDQPPPQKPVGLAIEMNDLNDYEKTAILKLNRLLLEELYPGKIPKRLEKGLIIDWINITVAIPDFKTLEGNISEAAIKQSCDDMAKYLQEWKVFKKVGRTVSPDTDLILEGTIVRYKAIEGMDKAVQFLQGGILGNRFSTRYAYCFLEMKWIDTRTRDKIGAMMVNYVDPVHKALERGNPEIFLVDRFYYIFNFLIKSRSKSCIGLHPDLKPGCHLSDCEDIMDPKMWTGQ